jgi:lipopolysaccharide export system protein LptC
LACDSRRGSSFGFGASSRNAPEYAIFGEVFCLTGLARSPAADKAHQGFMTAGQTTFQDPIAAMAVGSVPAGVASDRLAAFERARRHSTRVRLLKIVLPAAAAVIFVSFLSYSLYAVPSGLSIDFGGTAIADGKLVMANPKLEGFTKDQQPYTMTATRALTDPQSTDVIELEEINAKLPIDAKTWAEIDALRGVFDRKKNTLTLPDTVNVKTTDGKTAKLKSVFVNVTNGALSTDQAVDIDLGGITVTAESMTVHKNGGVLIFKKKVRMNIDPGRFQSAADDTGESNDPN